MKRFNVRFTADAEADLLRLFDFLLEQDHLIQNIHIQC